MSMAVMRLLISLSLSFTHVVGPATASLALAFGAGVLSTLNPCGFALLPAYVSYRIEQQVDTAPEGQSTSWHRPFRGRLLGLPIAAGFLLVCMSAWRCLDLVGRLIDAYPKTVVGLKDSSGDWNNTVALLERFPGFAVFPGSEVFLLDGLRKGAVGCITASGNVNVPGIRKVYENWKTPQADALQAEITTARKTIQAYPMVPALKRIVAHFHNDPDWAAVRPPMVPLDAAQSRALLADLAKIGFTLGEARRAAAE